MIIDPKWLSEVRETLQSKALWLFLLLIAGGPLVLPTRATAFLGIEAVRTQFRPWLGASLLASAAGLIVALLSSSDSWWQRRKRAKFEMNELRDLSPDEKAVLYGYMSQKSKTRYFDPTNGIVMGLEDAP